MNSKQVIAQAVLQGAGSVHYLAISGMSCASCVSTVESALERVEGTHSVSVNFADQSARIVGQAGLESLISAVRKAGYDATTQDNNDNDARVAQIEKELRRAFLESGIALVVGAGLMLGMWFDLLPAQSDQLFWLGMSLAVATVMFYSGRKFFSAALNALTHGTTTMDTLIVLGTSTAWLYSTLIILWPELVPVQSRHLFFEAAVLIIGFVGLGKALESHAKGKTSLAISQLLNLQPPTAIKVETGSDGVQSENVVPVAMLETGDVIRLLPGQAVPVDGVVLRGESSIDESMLTGESLPIEKTEGAKVVAGTINQQGMLLIAASEIGDKTVLAGIVKLIREAQNSKPKIGRITDKIASVFVPIVIAISIVTAAVWLIYGPEPRVAYAVSTAMAVLIIACPCALGLAIPMSIMVGIGRAAGEGLLIRNSDALQAASKLTTVVIDKTGTLTEGKPGIIGFEVSQKYQKGEDGLLRIARSLEKLSEHPLARGVVAYCDARVGDVPTAKVSHFTASPGGGVKGEIDGEIVAIGNTRYMAAHHMALPAELSDPKMGPATTIYVGLGKHVIGAFYLRDQIKNDSKASIKMLRELGLKIVMLTGDSQEVAIEISEQLGLADFVAEMSPEQKLDYIRGLQNAGEKVGMVGDGINDSLALSTADVGFAMGAGTDIAIQSADVALLSNSVAGVAKAILLSRYCLRNIYQNLAGAFGYNLLLIPLAAGAFFPWFGWLINPAFAGVAMAASSITVVTNANRLRFFRLGHDHVE